MGNSISLRSDKWLFFQYYFLHCSKVLDIHHCCTPTWSVRTRLCCITVMFHSVERPGSGEPLNVALRSDAVFWGYVDFIVKDGKFCSVKHCRQMSFSLHEDHCWSCNWPELKSPSCPSLFLVIFEILVTEWRNFCYGVTSRSLSIMRQQPLVHVFYAITQVHAF